MRRIEGRENNIVPGKSGRKAPISAGAENSSAAGHGFFLGCMLLKKHFLHERAGVNDLGIRYPIVDVHAFAPRAQNALVAHNGKMLGYIRL